MTSMKLIACKYCGNLIRPCNIAKHEARHENNPKSFEERPFKLNHEGLDCQFCNKTYKNRNSLCNHERLCKENPNRQQSYLSNQGWAKGLNKNSDIRVKNNSLSKIEHFKGCSGNFKGHCHSEETKRKLSEAQLKIDHDAHDRNSHGKRGYIDDIFFMSTWELAYYIYMRDHGHKISRCNLKFDYEYEGKKHKYTPDFILDGHAIIEVKGRETSLDQYKYTLVDNLQVVYMKDILPMISWVKANYGIDDLSSLYNTK